MLKEFPIQAEGFAGSWNDTSISISLYSFVTIDIYSVPLGLFLDGFVHNPIMVPETEEGLKICTELAYRVKGRKGKFCND